MTIRRSTIVENTSLPFGAVGVRAGTGISGDGAAGMYTISGSIIAGNTPRAGDDCGSAISVTDGGWNVFGTDAPTPGGCNPGTTSVTADDPQLDADGAPTLASPALNLAAGCPGDDATDLRGTPRPQHGACDAGAIEALLEPDTARSRRP